MRASFEEFSKRTIKEIRLWFWVATSAPIAALATMFFVWAVGTDDALNAAMTIGASIMFTTAVIWWWWALHSIYQLITLWSRTETTVTEVKYDLKDLKMDIRKLSFDKDK